MGLPDEDRIPYRHAYGNYTHYSSNGKYRFEWTPFTPAVKAWQDAQYYLNQALKDLADAQRLTGFGLNGLADEHAQMMGAVKVLAEDAQACHTEAGKVVQVLETANTDYANANEASLEQYQALMKVIDGVTGRQGTAHTNADNAEKAIDAQQDQKIFPFDGTK